MPAVARLADFCLGHCYEPRANVQGSENVFVNGRPVHLLSHYWPTHTCGQSSHDSITVQGSENIFVNGLPLARIGDALSCGDMIAEGSENVFAN